MVTGSAYLALLLSIAPSSIGTVSGGSTTRQPQATAARFMREGSEHGSAGRHAEAAAAFAQAAALQPRAPDAHSYLGSALASLGRREEAILATAAAAALRPRDAGILIHHGSLLQNSVDPPPAALAGQQKLIDDRLRDAMMAFQTAREVAPRNPAAWMNSGIVAVQLSHEGADEEMAISAIEYAQHAVELDPSPMGNTEKVLASAWAARAASASKHSKPPRLAEQTHYSEKAIDCYDRILAANPNDAFALHFRGARLENIGRWTEAIADFKAVTALVPTDPTSWEAAALTHEHLNEHQLAIEAAQRAIDLGARAEKLGGAYRTIGNAMGGLGRHAEAEVAFEKAVQFINDDASLWFFLGSSRWVWYPGTRDEADPYLEASHSYDRALELEPTHARAKMERAFSRGHSRFIQQGSVSPDDAADLLSELQEAERLHEQLLADVDDVSQEKHSHWKTGTATSFSWVRQQAWTHPSALPIIPASVARLGTSPGLIIELGVWTGSTIREIARLVGAQFSAYPGGAPRIHGFDSFLGLPEDWTGREQMVKGTFNLNGKMPTVPENVVLHAGWFNETLPPFILTELSAAAATVGYVHVDCNLFSSVYESLAMLSPWFVQGTVLLFDDWLVRHLHISHDPSFICFRSLSW